MKKVAFIFILASFLSKAGTPSIIFKENKGQWPDKVLFGSEFFNAKFYVNKNSFNYCFYKTDDLPKEHDLLIHYKDKSLETNFMVHGHNYEVRFLNADLTNSIRTQEQNEYYNYFIGNNKNNWANHVKAYGNLLFNEIYKDVDLKLYSNNANLKYDFIIKPGGNVNNIKLNYKYTNGIEIRNNELIIKTSVAEIIEKEPFAYQFINGIQKQIKCKYILLNDNTAGFIFPDGYDAKHELIIDPTVVVASYSGSIVNSDNSACTYDEFGNIYNAGYSHSGYPNVDSAFHMPVGVDMDCVISCYNKTGSVKNFATYIGGDSLDFPIDIAVKKGVINLFGQTYAKNFPCTSTAFDTTNNGKTDFFVSKLNITGSILMASTYVGGDFNEGVTLYSASPLEIQKMGEMACDTAGNVYILSSTTSTNFPVSASAYSPIKKGTVDACVFKLDKNLSNLVWSTYLGGTRDETGRGIRLDGSGGVYCLGATTSSNFPVSSGCLQPIKGGLGVITDCYVTHLNSTGSNLIASTYLGTTNADYPYMMDIDLNGDIYVVGALSVPSLFTVTPTSIYNSVNGHNFIYKLNGSLTNIIYKTKYGNLTSGVDPNFFISAFKVDSCQNLYFSGYAQNSFQTTPGAFQSYGGGPTDIYVAEFSTNCISLKFASFWGGPKKTYGIGEHEDGGISHFDNHGYLYQAVCTTGGIPTTAGGYAPLRNSPDSMAFNDAILKIDFQTFINAGSSYGANITGCPPFTTQFVSTTNTGSSYWNLGDGTTTTLDTITHTYNNLGTYNVLLVVTDTTTCNRTDSIKSILNVINPTTFDLGDDVPACLTMPAILQSPVTAVSYSWSTGQTTSSISATPGTYTLTINNGGCNSSDVVNVIIAEKKLSERFPNVITPNGDLVNDWIDFTKYNFEEVEFYLYDRWGRERFKITNSTEQWQAKDLDNGTYFWVARYRSSCIGKYATDKGFITIFK